jgi:hypothetical protein
MVKDRAVIMRCSDFLSAYETARYAYRNAYHSAYERMRQAVQATIHEIKQGDAYGEAPEEQRDAVINKVFGPGGTCHYSELQLGRTKALLDATTRDSLTSLAQGLVALSGYRNQVEAELRTLMAKPSRPGEKAWEWTPGPYLTGWRLRTEKEVDELFQKIGEALKKRIREGFTIVVK